MRDLIITQSFLRQGRFICLKMNDLPYFNTYLFILIEVISKLPYGKIWCSCFPFLTDKVRLNTGSTLTRFESTIDKISAFGL